MAGYVHKLRFVELTTLSSGLVKSTFSRGEQVIWEAGMRPQTRKETKWHGHKHGRIFAGVRENK